MPTRLHHPAACCCSLQDFLLLLGRPVVAELLQAATSQPPGTIASGVAQRTPGGAFLKLCEERIGNANIK